MAGGAARLCASSHAHTHAPGFSAVHVHELNFVIPVGDGLQDMRWLALVAAARYAAKIRPKGSARQREHKSRMESYVHWIQYRRRKDQP